ncbi:hypothetical protein [Seohaeicola zhoushanensis]|uniref:Uncharacterized protein n=1 Tax=Seohaeicola zhoushanensis TaxID=1569283 RepID=A0A8J3GWB8_9RHOB|nr:hypothetical protein [Seohaeicola zhoushanensis]GHF45097.1 hypothetical protein GCM10017056_15860 [Seohaeicola zhoushanensis]
MSDQTHSTLSGGNGALAFILGGVVVALLVLGWIIFGGKLPGTDQPDIRIELPGGKAVEGTVTGN